MKKIISFSLFVVIVIVSLVYLQLLDSDPIPDLSACETPSKLRTCPEKLGRVFLPRTYPARAIYVGFSNDNVHVEFLDSLLKEVSELKIKPVVNILVPRIEDQDAYEHLKKYFDIEKFNFINLIPTSSKDTVWAQDYLEIMFDTQKAKSIIIDLPYFDREGENIPTSIALACQKELIAQGEFSRDIEPGNGDYGGNIEAITSRFLIVGNNITDETLKILKNLTTQSIIELDVEWLETGHVDEIVTTLPHTENAGACDQSLLAASPELALQIVEKLPMDSQEYSNTNLPFYDEEVTWPDRYFCLHPKFSSWDECKELKKANMTYQASINESVEKIQIEMERNHGCRLEVKKFPQLFLPVVDRKDYGTFDDRAVAFNPNSVNNIFFFPKLMLAKQEFPPFQEVVDEVLSKFPYKKIFVDGKFVHELNGGIHCATNISYGCSI